MSSAIQHRNLRLGRRVTALSILASAVLAAANIFVGLVASSTSVVAAGLEFFGDVLATTLVLASMFVAARPADANHPYGYGRYETIAGFLVGVILAVGGAGIAWRSLHQTDAIAPAGSAVWPLLAAIVVRGVMSTVKFRVGRRIHSASLVADAWNDAIDIVSAAAALIALGLTLYDPARFGAADHYGGLAVGVVVIFTGLRVMRDTSRELADAAPDEVSLQQIRTVALGVPGVLGVEKCLARKTGLQHHVDLHLEVDPNLTMWESHEIAGQTRSRLREQLYWIADAGARGTGAGHETN